MHVTKIIPAYCDWLWFLIWMRIVFDPHQRMSKTNPKCHCQVSEGVTFLIITEPSSVWWVFARTNLALTRGYTDARTHESTHTQRPMQVTITPKGKKCPRVKMSSRLWTNTRIQIRKATWTKSQLKSINKLRLNYIGSFRPVQRNWGIKTPIRPEYKLAQSGFSNY